MYLNLIKTSQKNDDEDSKEGYIFKVDVEYPKNLINLHSDLPLLSEKIKINKCKKLACNLYDEKEYIAYIRALKQTINHGLILKKVHSVKKYD